MNEAFDPQWFEEHLGSEAKDPPALLQQRILERTHKAMRLQRWKDRFVRSASLAASFLAGMLALHLFHSMQPPKVVVVERKTVAPENVVPSPPHQPEKEPPSAVALEWKAVETERERPEIYKKAGDHYLEENDLDSALRCYSQSLGDSEEELQLVSSDTWLLMAIKNARQRERIDVRE